MKIRLPIIFLKTILLLSLTVIVSTVFAAPKKDLWEYWKASNELSKSVVDHSYWDYLLQKYVTTNSEGINVVKYENFPQEDMQRLDLYIGYLTKIPVLALRRNEQMAYWINLYNAYTLKVVLDHYPVSSIRKINISPGTFSRGPWDKKVLLVSNQVISLNDIEHRILRPIWNDDRIHYALNCASIGCPNLLKEAYTSANLEANLDRARKEYINHERGVKISSKGDLIVSSLYDWYIEDFAISEEDLVKYLLKYLNDGDVKDKVNAWAPESNKIKYKYDWDLNDIAKK